MKSKTWVNRQKNDQFVKKAKQIGQISRAAFKLEEIEKKEALEKYGSEGSGKNLPFSSLSDDLKKKEEETNSKFSNLFPNKPME